MALSKIKELRELTDEALVDEIVAVKQQLFQLRFQKATRQLETPHLFKHTRHRLAQLMTIERERQLQGLTTAVATSAETEDVVAQDNEGVESTETIISESSEPSQEES